MTSGLFHPRTRDERCICLCISLCIIHSSVQHWLHFIHAELWTKVSLSMKDGDTKDLSSQTWTQRPFRIVIKARRNKSLKTTPHEFLCGEALMSPPFDLSLPQSKERVYSFPLDAIRARELAVHPSVCKLGTRSPDP
jgi:hypothetical protein